MMFNDYIKYYRVDYGSKVPKIITLKTLCLEDYLEQVKQPNTYKSKKEAEDSITQQNLDFKE